MSTISQAETVQAARSRRFGAWYVAEHRFRVMRSYAQTVVLTGIGNPLVYLYALGVGLATLVDQNLGAGAVDGVGYLQFVAPALLGMAAVTVAAEEFTYPIMIGFKWNPTFYAMNAAPISPAQIIGGLLISITARMLATCGLYYVFMLAFGAVIRPEGALMILVAVLVGLGFGSLLMAYTATLTEDTGQLAMLMRFVIVPMTLFSGTFFPLTQLPIFLQWLGWLSPLWHGVELSRVLGYGMVEPLWLSVVHVAYPAALLVAGWWLSIRLADRRLNK